MFTFDTLSSVTQEVLDEREALLAICESLSMELDEFTFRAAKMFCNAEKPKEVVKMAKIAQRLERQMAALHHIIDGVDCPF